MEEWKDIKGYEGFYQISNFGRVKSLGGWCGTAKRKEKIRSTSLTHDGYVKVRLIHQGLAPIILMQNSQMNRCEKSESYMFHIVKNLEQLHLLKSMV